MTTDGTDSVREAAARDDADPLRHLRDLFDLPQGLVYLDGNSLGALPKGALARAVRTVRDEWGTSLISSWNDHGWIDLPLSTGARIAPLIGAAADEVVVADSVSVNLFKLVGAALMARPGRRKIVTDAANFPTDIYILEGVAAFRGMGVEIKTVPIDEIPGALDEDCAALCLSHVDYRSARIEDMAQLTAAAHAAGALAIWDLSHSAGAIEVVLNACAADFAVGCGYKYLNGGPGAPAYLFAAERHHAVVNQPLSGWLGHAAPFAFAPRYAPADGIRRFVTGTPPVLSLSVLDEALKVFDGVALSALRAKAMALTDFLIDSVARDCAGLDLTLASPRQATRRGSHVLFDHPEGYAVVQALKARGVVGDFRAPYGVRLGVAALYNSFGDIAAAVDALRQVLVGRDYERPEFRIRAAVT